MSTARRVLIAFVLMGSGCTSAPLDLPDAAGPDAEVGDAARVDAGQDAGASDAFVAPDGNVPADAGFDAFVAPTDGGLDAFVDDVGTDAPLAADAGTDALVLDGLCDVDGDRHASLACGGDDCDDGDAMRFPTNLEVCDAAGHDEDCDATTYGTRDGDGDGFVDGACCNTDALAVARCGPDCDDGRATVHPGAPELCDGLDSDCASGGGAVTAEDADGDMHAPIGASCTGGFPADDCIDTNALVHPGQTAFFTTQLTGVPYARWYDYDCDGTSVHQDTTLASCSASPPCTATPGWDGLVPPCGNGVDYITSCRDLGGACSPDRTTAPIRYAACH